MRTSYCRALNAECLLSCELFESLPKESPFVWGVERASDQGVDNRCPIFILFPDNKNELILSRYRVTTDWESSRITGIGKISGSGSLCILFRSRRIRFL